MSLSLDASTGPAMGPLSPLPDPFPGVEVEGSVPLSPGAPELCWEHGETLTMFCVDDLEPVCQQCGATGSHAGHRVYPITEAVTDCKGELITSTSKLQVKVIQLEKVIQTCEHASKHNQVQARETERQIEEEFDKLHQFLCEEEEARLAALREEEEERKRVLAGRRDRLTQSMESLEQKIRQLEEDMEAEGDGVEFLQNYQDTIRSTWQSYKPPKKVCGPLIDVAKYLGNLQFSVWDEMRYVAPYTPLTLDPRTASLSLSLSAGLDGVQKSSGTSQSHKEDQDPGVSVPENPENPERFHPYSSILAREGYSSGTHCWDVLVGDSNSWTIGVASQSLHRREEFEPCPEAGLWAISRQAGEYKALTTPSQILHRDYPLRRVRVRLDWDQGQLDFMDVDADAHLFTFTQRFTEKVYPYFESVSFYGGLSVLPYGVSVSLEPIPVEDAPITEEGQVTVNGWSNEGEVTEINRSIGNGTEMSEIGGQIKDQTPLAKSKKKTAEDGTHTNHIQTLDKGSTNSGKPQANKSANKNQTGKTTDPKSPGKKQTTKTRFNVTYQVSLNRALKLRDPVSTDKDQLVSHT